MNAEDELERVYHEMRQCLRATAVGPLISNWAAREPFLVAAWDALRPNVETRGFEDAADRLRAEAVALADGLDRLSALKRAELGESQAYQAEAAIRLHHYLTPKLLLLAAAAGRALREPGAAEGRTGASRELIDRGAPPRMPALELVDETAAEPALQRVFKDVKRARGLSTVPPVLRGLALWPRYLEAAWDRLKPASASPAYAEAAASLTGLAAELAASLPYQVDLPLDALARRVDLEGAREDVEDLEHLLPALCLDAALLALDWQAPEILRRSPYPVRARAAALSEAA